MFLQLFPVFVVADAELVVVLEAAAKVDLKLEAVVELRSRVVQREPVEAALE